MRQPTLAVAEATVPAYHFSTAEKIRMFFPCLRQRLKPRRHLIAGPFAGEFGLELMQWQGYVRARRAHYEQAHVITYPGRDYLYENCVVHYHDIRLEQAGYGYGLMSPSEAKNMAQAKAAELGLEDYDIFSTTLLCTQYHKRLCWRQDFRVFEEPPLADRIYDIAFHFRAVRKVGPDNVKNCPPARCDELAACCRALGLSLCCIGHPDYSYCAKGAEDFRSVDLRRTVAGIASARAVAGEISGPMHLANVCGKATIVWANDQWRIENSLRWNPFRVPIYCAANDTYQPEPQRVCEAIRKALEDLEKRTECFSKPCYTLPAQRIACNLLGA